MPGIVGIVSVRPAGQCESTVRTMLATMQHEQFYKSGTYSAPDLGVYAGWVAHESSFSAAQPFKSEDETIVILLSGECFIDPQARDRQPDSPGVKRTVGTWLTDFYDEQGARMFEKLNGLFSGVLIDRKQGKAFLFNDRYGTERIYWHETKDAMFFASEAKALLRVLPTLRTFDPEGVAQFLTLGCTVDWRTLFRGMQILPGGSRWSFQDQTTKKERYFQTGVWESLPDLSIESFQQRLDETFQRVLPRYFQANSQLGIALTGGLDTRMILACEPEDIERPVSYTFTGQFGRTYDDRVAAEVAKVCGLDHHLLRLKSDFFSNFATHADRTVFATDGCFGVTGAHEIYFNRQARELAPVRLTGLFGSEILRGVSTFKPHMPSRELLDLDFAKIVDASLAHFRSEKAHPVTSAAFRNIPWNLFPSMAANRSQVVLRTPYLDNEIVALAYQMPAALRKSPAAALNLIRSNNPLLGRVQTDRRVEDKGAPFPRNVRRLFREVGFKIDYYYNEGMPHSGARFDPVVNAIDSRVRILGHHKFLHYRSWFQKELAPYVLRVVADARVQQSPFWERHFLNDIVKAHTQGYGNYVLAINSILTLEAVERLLFRDFADAPNWPD